MKKIISHTVLGLALLSALTTSTALLAHADDAPVSAPNVVAPAQPATVQNTNPGTAPVATGAEPAPAPGPMQLALPFIVMLGIMYFLMIRPQQKRMKEHQNLVTNLKTGDEVITTSGIIGTIAGMSEKVVTLEVAKNVQLRVLKSQVNQIVKGQIQDIQANA